jgi:hypothetical protein
MRIKPQKKRSKKMAIKEPKEENWLTPENMKAYIKHLDEIDEMIEMQIQMYIEDKKGGAE